MRNILVKVPGSCGEFVQGMLNNEPFLITCPVNLFTTVLVSDKFSGHFGLGWKSKIMLERTLKYFECNEFNFGIKLETDLPRGKGMASSSADLAAICKAAALALNFDITAQEIAKLAASIEPTDGIFYDEIVAMNPVTGKLLKTFQDVPKYKIAVFDFGSEVNTLEFERRSNLYLNELPQHLNMNLVTKSAIANQKILYKNGLEKIIKTAKNFGALGVNAAHTGTVIGIIFNEDFESKKIEEIALIMAKKFSQIKFMTLTKVVSGGIKISEVLS